jgi:hypothetical protein
MKSLILVTVYLLICLAGAIVAGYELVFGHLSFPAGADLLFECILIAGFGGILYCLRSVYLSFSVKKEWAQEWIILYFIRPIVSLLCGGVSFLFLKAGLLVLEAKRQADSSNLGFLAFAFIAGLNVDKFIAKIEELAKATWGVEKTKATIASEKATKMGTSGATSTRAVRRRSS